MPIFVVSISISVSSSKLIYAQCYSVDDYRDGSQLIKLSTDLEADDGAEDSIEPGCIAFAVEIGDSLHDHFIPGSVYIIDITIASFISMGDA